MGVSWSITCDIVPCLSQDLLQRIDVQVRRTSAVYHQQVSFPSTQKRQVWVTELIDPYLKKTKMFGASASQVHACQPKGRQMPQGLSSN